MASSRSSTMPILKQEFFPVYDLDWVHLKGFLERRFPGYTFEERIVRSTDLKLWHLLTDRQVVKDYYHFDVPEPLTKAGNFHVDLASWSATSQYKHRTE